MTEPTSAEARATEAYEQWTDGKRVRGIDWVAAPLVEQGFKAGYLAGERAGAEGAEARIAELLTSEFNTDLGVIHGALLAIQMEPRTFNVGALPDLIERYQRIVAAIDALMRRETRRPLAAPAMDQ